MPSLTRTSTYSGVGAALQVAAETFTAGQSIDIEEAIAFDADDLEVAFALDVSQLQFLVIHCDQDITIETNNGTTPDDTIDVDAGVPIEQRAGANTPIATDITTNIFVKNDAGVAATLKIKAIVDPTV